MAGAIHIPGLTTEGIKQASATDTRSPQQPSPRRRQKRSRQSYFAVVASEGVIDYPRRSKPLGELEQARLVRRAQAGDTQALQTLWLAHARLAYTVVNRCRVHPQDVPDALQAAQLGLLRAIQKFDLSRLNAFSTYAYWWLRQAVMRHRVKTDRQIPIPSHLYARYCEYRRETSNAIGAHGWFDAAQRLLENGPNEYERLLRIHSLAKLRPLPPEDLAPICEAPSPLDRAATQERRQGIAWAIEELDPREQQVIRWRYGFTDDGDLTLEQAGERLGVTRERVRQIQAKAERKLKKLLSKHKPGILADMGLMDPNKAQKQVKRERDIEDALQTASTPPKRKPAKKRTTPATKPALQPTTWKMPPPAPKTTPDQATPSKPTIQQTVQHEIAFPNTPETITPEALGNTQATNIQQPPQPKQAPSHLKTAIQPPAPAPAPNSAPNLNQAPKQAPNANIQPSAKTTQAKGFNMSRLIQWFQNLFR